MGTFSCINTDLVETTEQTEVMQEMVRARIWVSLHTLNASYCCVPTKIAVQTASVCALETPYISFRPEPTAAELRAP